MAKLKSGTRVYGGLTVDTTLLVQTDATITGNLTVNGTTTSVNTTNITVKDPIIDLGGGADGAALTTNDGKDRGTLLRYFDAAAETPVAKNAFMGWDNSSGEFAVASNVTIVGEIVTSYTYGKVRAGIFYGDAAGLTNIQGAQVSGTVASATAATTAGTVTTNAQPAINSVGNLSGLQVGNAGTAGTVVISNNGNLVATGNITADYFFGDGSLLTGVLADTAKKTAFGSSSVDIPLENGNINMSVGGTANVAVISTGGVNVAGYVNSTGNMIAQNFTSATGNVEVANAKISGLTSTRVAFANVDHFLVDDSTFTFTTATSLLKSGNLELTGLATAANVKVTSLTEGKITFAGVDGRLVDDTTLTFATGSSTLGSGNIQITDAANVNEVIVRSLASTRVPFVDSDKSLTDDSTFTFATSGSLLKSGNLEIANVANVDEVIVRSLTAGQVTFADSDKSLTNSANLTFATDTLSVPNATLTGTAQAAEVIVTSLTAGQVTFADSNKSLTNSANLTFATDTLSVPNATLTGTVTAATLKSTNLNSTRVPFTNASNSLTDSANLTFASNTLSVDNVTLVPTGNLTGGNLVSASYLTGTLTTQAQPNITSTGTLTSVTVSGDAVVQGNVKTDNILANATNITVTAGGTNGAITLAPQGTGTVDVSSKRITSVATPTGSSDAATKGYVDANSQGLDVKQSVRLATTADRALTGLTAVDGVTPVAGDRILVRNQTTKSENGIYVAASGAWTRADDANLDGELSGGSFTFVEEGTAYADTGWVVTTNGAITLGTNDIDWTQFSGAGAYTAGSGLTLTGGEFSVNTDGTTTAIVDGNVVVKASAQLTTPNIGAANGTSLDLGAGTITADGSLLTNINGANVSEVALATNVSAGAQGNITSVGTLSSLTVSGAVNVTTANLTIGTTGSIYGIKTDNYWYANGVAIDFQTAAGLATQIQFKSSTGDDLAASANLTFNSTTNELGVVGTLSVSSTATVGNLETAGTIVGANVTAQNLTTLNGIVFSDTNKKLYNNANVFLGASETLTAPNATVTTNFSAANVKATSLTKTNGIVFSDNTGKLINNANVYLGTDETLTAPNASITSTLSVSDISISTDIDFTASGNISGANVISATTLSGTLSTAAQTNITSVGTLTGLTSGGVVNLTTASNVALGAVGNVHITGGSSGQVLTTDGSGLLSWATNDTSTIVNGASDVSIADVNGTVKTHVNTALILEVTGTGANVTGILDVTGNINSGNNISAANLITAGGGIDSTSSITGTVKVDGGIAATGNIYTGQSVGFADNAGGSASKAYIQFNATANSLDFIFD